MKRIKLTAFSDPQHGWLSVPRKMLTDLGIEKEISHFSYQKGNRVYLEEDRDASIFYNTFFRREGYGLWDRGTITHHFEVKDSWTNNQSPVRYYNRYQP